MTPPAPSGALSATPALAAAASHSVRAGSAAPAQQAVSPAPPLGVLGVTVPIAISPQAGNLPQAADTQAASGKPTRQWGPTVDGAAPAPAPPPPVAVTSPQAVAQVRADAFVAAHELAKSDYVSSLLGDELADHSLGSQPSLTIGGTGAVKTQQPTCRSAEPHRVGPTCVRPQRTRQQRLRPARVAIWR